MEDVTVNLTEWLTATALAAIPAVVGLLWKRIRSATGPEKVEVLTNLARVAVFAAEELGHKNGKVGEEVSGREKLAYAVARLEDLSKRVHVKVDNDQAEALIEAVLNETRPYTQLPDVMNVGAEPEVVSH